jgi:hypothetical protein
MIGPYLNNELERLWKETAVVCFKAISGIFSEGLRKTMENLSQEAGLLAAIRTQNPMNTMQQCQLPDHNIRWVDFNPI